MSLAPAAVGLFPSDVMEIIRRPRLQVLPLAPASLAGSRTRTALSLMPPLGAGECCQLTTHLGSRERETHGWANDAHLMCERLCYATLFGKSSIWFDFCTWGKRSYDHRL